MTVVPWSGGGRYLRVEEAGEDLLPIEATPAFVTHVHRLRSLTADVGASLLEHFKSRYAGVEPYTPTNALIITDTEANIREMLRILAVVDVPAAVDR